MENELIFRILLAVLLVSFIVHRGIYSRRNTPPEDQVLKEKEPGSSEKFSGLLGVVAFLSSLIYFFAPTWLRWAEIGLPTWLRWVGVPLALLGFGVIEWGQRALGSNWSDTPVLIKDQTLATAGPYRWVRHPIYTGFLLILSAPLLISSNWLIGLAWMLMTFIDVQSRAEFEEGILMETFGKAYEERIKTTGRFFPRLGAGAN